MKAINNTLLHGALLLVIAAEGLAGYEMLTLHGSQKIFAVGLHVMLVPLFCLLIKQITLKRAVTDANFILVSFMVALALPFYGMLGMGLIYLSMRLIQVKSPAYFEVEEDLLPARPDFLHREVEKNIVGIKQDELDIMAFRDIFKNRDRQLQENAINKLSKIVNKRSVAILQEVIKNTNSDTKILAASALIDMEERIINRIEEIRNHIKEYPDDAAAILELARTYDLYCYLDILDSAVKNYYRELALAQYQKFLRCQPDHLEANLEYGRLLLSKKDINPAIAALKKALQLAPNDPNPYIWLAEAYYESANFHDVADICGKLAEMENLPENLKEIISWWNGGKEAPNLFIHH